MITYGERLSGNPILIGLDKKATKLNKINFTDRTIQEEWLQDIIQKTPDLLPFGEIQPVYEKSICIGREVPVDSGYIDHLFISAQGYLSIVETKLWRNPEARRQVVAQIIDYAKDISQWSFSDLETQVKEYNKTYRNIDNSGVIDTLKSISQINNESYIADTISKNLKQGRILLLIVGDGIKEETEELVDYITQFPQLNFSLALVELQAYDIPENKTRLIFPQVVTRTKEIIRTIISVEGTSIENLKINILPQGEDPVQKQGTRFKLDEDAYFTALSENVEQDIVEFAKKIISDFPNLGCFIDWMQGSFVIRVKDPYGSKNAKLTLLVITKTGDVYTDWFPDQLERLGLDINIGYEYVKNAAILFKNCAPDSVNPNFWTRRVTLNELKEKYEEFIKVVKYTVDKINTEAVKGNQ
ncbi:MAG: hypothetical protein Q8O74_02875 [bacterium]|nr:hypothetical protein [bacterium]